MVPCHFGLDETNERTVCLSTGEIILNLDLLNIFFLVPNRQLIFVPPL